MELKQQWKGSRPNRFQGSRKHICPENQLNQNLQPKLSTLSTCGIKTFERHTTQQQKHRSHLKIFPSSYQLSHRQIDLRGKKYLGASEQQNKRRAQRAHISGNYETIDQVKLKGIKPFEIHNKKTKNQHYLESDMQRKIRVGGLSAQRNHVSVRALGDKPYQYPEYETDFYKVGGLISGSTIKPRTQTSCLDKKVGSVFTKPNWDIKVKLEEAEQEKNVVNSVDQWQQTILKEANPNWNDPDTFFERMQAAKNQKQIKKGGKK